MVASRLSHGCALVQKATFCLPNISIYERRRWVALHNEMLESQVGKSSLRIGPSPTDREGDDGVGPCAESDNREGDDSMYHATTVQYHRQRSRNQMEDPTHKASLADRCSRTGATRVVGIVQQCSLNDSRRRSHKTASPTFPSSRKRPGVALHESPSRERDVNVSINQIPYRKKFSLSRSFQNHRTTEGTDLGWNEISTRPSTTRSQFAVSGMRDAGDSIRSAARC
jgi:hypothetical protein